jgi:tetratricopeptide (TPR) repeat protein
MTAGLQQTDTRTRGARNISAALSELAELHFEIGDWWAANSCAREALRTARACGRQRELMYALARLACVEAGLGEAGPCRRHAAEAVRLSRELGEPSVEALAGEVLGFLELGLASPRCAVEQLERVEQIWRASRRARGLARRWPIHLADAHARLGNRAAAEAALERVDRRATGNGSFVLAAAYERSRGMLAAGDAFEPRFRRALQWNAWAKQPFELARTQLCFGERLRRAGRSGQARAQLTAAHTTFGSLGARPWAAAASRELELTAT